MEKNSMENYVHRLINSYIRIIKIDEFVDKRDELYNILDNNVRPIMKTEIFKMAGREIDVKNRTRLIGVMPEYKDVEKCGTYRIASCPDGMKADVCPGELIPYIHSVEKNLRKEGILTKKFTNLYINRYELDGVIGYHADNDKNLNVNEPIVSISLGTRRVFRVMMWALEETSKERIKRSGKYDVVDISQTSPTVFNKNNPDNKCVSFTRDYTLHHGTVLVMLPGLQEIAKHSIIPVKKSEYKELENNKYGGVRYNITLRRYYTS